MIARDDQIQAMPVRPVVFAAAGPNAVRTLSQLPQAARDLRVRVVGPFGLITLLHPPSGIVVSDHQWLSDIAVKQRGGEEDQSPCLGGPDDGELLASFRTLVRRLRPDRPNIAPDSSPRLRVSAYVVVDLPEPGAVSAALDLARLLRAADPSLDMTGLALTGRTAQSPIDPKEPWFETCAQLVGRLQDEPLLQRLYVLDGRDTNNTWLQTPTQMQRLAAEFLLHHGLSPYRGHLRRCERSRVVPGEDFLNVCGAFCCRTLRGDQSTMARRIAAKVVENDPALAEMSQGVLSDQRAQDLAEEAEHLADQIAEIYQGDVDESTDPDAAASVGSGHSADRDQEVLDVLKQTIARVCHQAPVASLLWFLGRFRPRLKGLLAHSALMDRMQSRYRTRDIVRHQMQKTYQPVRRWLGVRDAVFRGRFDVLLPPEKAPSEWVSEPAGAAWYAAGVALLLTGLAGVVAGTAGAGAAFTLAGALLAIASSVVMALPCREAQRRSVPIPEGGQSLESGESVPYRRKAPGWAPWVSAGLLALGLTISGLSLFRYAWLGDLGLRPPWLALGLAALLAVAGLALHVWRPAEAWHLERRLRPGHVVWLTESGHVASRELPWMVEAPPWLWRAAGLACLAVAGAVLCLVPPGLVMAGGTWGWIALVVGLLLAAGGVSLARWPWTARACLAHDPYPRPEPPLGGLVRPSKESALDKQVRRIGAWVQTLLAEPPVEETDHSLWPPPTVAETIPEALVKDWDARAADLFRRSLSSGPTGSLAEQAKDPQLWAEYLVAELTHPSVGLAEPAQMFALHAVSRWLQTRTWQELVADLQPDPQQLDSFVARVCSPRWPPTRGEPEVDASIVAVGESLWDVVAPLAKHQGMHRLVRAAWQDPQTLAVIRVVQGLSEGWRGFPALRNKTADPAGLPAQGRQPR